eukprot:8790016-Alexandrium_andersonii.AAC.1
MPRSCSWPWSGGWSAPRPPRPCMWPRRSARTGSSTAGPTRASHQRCWCPGGWCQWCPRAPQRWPRRARNSRWTSTTPRARSAVVSIRKSP